MFHSLWLFIAFLEAINRIGFPPTGESIKPAFLSTLEPAELEHVEPNMSHFLGRSVSLISAGWTEVCNIIQSNTACTLFLLKIRMGFI